MKTIRLNFYSIRSVTLAYYTRKHFDKQHTGCVIPALRW